MATWVLVSWDDGQSRVELEIDANIRLIAIRRIGDRLATVVLSLADGSRSRTLPPNFTEHLIGTGAAQRLQLTFDSERNRYDGLTGYVQDA